MQGGRGGGRGGGGGGRGPFDFNDPFGGFGGFGGQGSLMPSFFGGRDPFDDPFFTRPFRGIFDSGFPGMGGGMFPGMGGGMFPGMGGGMFPGMGMGRGMFPGMERLTMLPCSHRFHEDCIIHRLNIDINLQAHHNEQLANNVRAQTGEATRRGLEMERALTDLSKLDKGDRYQVLAKLRRCERDWENIKQEVERFGKQLQALDEPICQNVLFA